MAPGVDGLPAAAGPARPGDPTDDGAIDTVSPIDAYLASLPHRAVRQVKLAPVGARGDAVSVAIQPGEP